jgi:hypothetical protein
VQIFLNQKLALQRLPAPNKIQHKGCPIVFFTIKKSAQKPTINVNDLQSTSINHPIYSEDGGGFVVFNFPPTPPSKRLKHSMN